MFPLSSTLDLSLAASLGLALLVGLGFGFALERAGFGSARKLVAVFYFYDMAVVKVMFSAIVTAMVGIFLLSSAGLLDMGEIYLEPTNYLGAVLGGLVFGAGFVIGGYCPGTAMASCATGRLDGFAFVAGIFAGVYLYAELLSGFEVWLAASSRDDLTLPGLTGIPAGWFVLAFLAVFALAVWGMRAAERRFSDLRPRD